MTVQRDITFDMMKGIGILLVLVGHVWEVLIPHTHHIVYSFHMPLFFIVAGYFSKAYDEVGDRKATVRGYAKRLLLPFLFVAVVELLWMLFLGVTKHDWNSFICTGLIYLFGDTADWETPWGNIQLGVTWFLLTLFWTKVLFLYLSRWPRWILAVSLLLAVGALALHQVLPHVPWCLLQSLIALPLVTLGYEWRHLRLPVWAICLLIASWIASVLFTDLEMYGYEWGIYPLTLAGACGGTWVVYALCRLCAKYLPVVGKVLAWLGVCSLAIMCMHEIEISTHLGNRLRVLAGFQFSMGGMYLWRYGLTLLLGAACMYLPGIKKLFR